MENILTKAKSFQSRISPDGEKVAVAGYTGKKVPYQKKGNFHIHIFDRASGNLDKTISGLPFEISHVTFSRDGRYLAATLFGTEGFRVYSSQNWSEVEVYPETQYKDDCLWADFDPQNRLVITSWDSNPPDHPRQICLRLYELHDGKFKRILEKRDIGGKRPIVARFSPDGSLLAVGFKDNPPRVIVFDGKSLEPLYHADTEGLATGHLARVAWSRNSDLLYAGGGFSEGGINPILCWTEKGRGPATRLPAATDSIMDIWPLKDGRVVFGAYDLSFGILDPEGRRLHVNVPDIPVFYNQQKQLQLSRDGRMVEFAFAMQGPDLTQGNYLARLDINTRKFTVNPPSEAGGQELRPPDTAGFKDSDWKNTKSPRFHNRLLSIGAEEVSHCLTRIPGGRGFILGTNWHLRFFTENGAPRGRPIELPSAAEGVNVSGDGRVAVVALGDGTLRWYRLDKRKEILAFFRHKDGRWVLWSPEGFFTCSTDGGKLIGYHLNEGLEKTPQFVTSDQLYNQFYRRDLVAWHLENVPANKIQAALPHGSAQQVLEQGPPPTVEIVSRKKLNDRDYLYELKITDRGGGIGQFVYRLNGINRKPTINKGEDFDLPGRTAVVVTFNRGEPQKVAFSSLNSRNTAESEPAIDSVTVPGETLRSLYVLSIGVGDYHGQHKDLPRAVPDAKNLAQTLKTRGQGIFQSSPHCTVLLNDEANLANIEKVFRDLKKQINSEDVFILYLSGHGSLQDGRYHFILSNPDPSIRQSLSQDKLNELLRIIPATRSLVILDTCHAGAFTAARKLYKQRNTEDTAFYRFHKDTGRPTLASCSELKVAKDGVFTFFLIRGLEGEADLRKNGGNGNKRIALCELYSYLRYEVPRKTLTISGYEQNPWANFQDQQELEIAALQDSGLTR